MLVRTIMPGFSGSLGRGQAVFGHGLIQKTQHQRQIGGGLQLSGAAAVAALRRCRQPCGLPQITQAGVKLKRMCRMHAVVAQIGGDKGARLAVIGVQIVVGR